MIRVENVIKEFGDARILHGVSFEVPAGSVLGVVGASGSGKSTLLRCLNGLELISGGAFECAGVRLEAGLAPKEYQRRVWRLRRGVGTVFQHLYLFPHLSALGNVTEAPVRVLKVAPREAEAQARALLERVGLKEASRRYPDSLSGGEQQRVAIARALAMRPGVILFDEPTSALDPKRTNEIRAMLREFAHEGGQTLMIVSHSLNFLKGLADYLLYMEGGRVVEFGAADAMFAAPREARTRDFFDQAK